MNVIELIQEGTGITKKITDLKWSFGYGPSKYWQIFDIIASLTVPTLSARSRTQITHLITIHKEYIIRAILSKIAGKQEYADISTSDIKLSIKKMKELGITWPELDTIQKSLDAEFQRRLTEASYGLQSVDDEEIYNDIDSNFRYDKIFGTIEQLVRLQNQNVFKNRPELYRDILSLINDYREEISNKFLSIITQSNYDVVILSIGRLYQFGVESTWLTNWIENNKSNIIKRILLDLSDSKLLTPEYVVMKLKSFGYEWPELAIIERSIFAEKKRQTSLTEDILNNHNYGGWIDSKNKKIYYVDEYKHISQALRMGADPMDTNSWMFRRGYVRFVTRSDHNTTLALEGKQSDIQSTFKIWWPLARRCETLYIDTSDTNLHSAYNISNLEDRNKVQKLFGPQTVNVSEETVNDSNYGGWIDSKK